MKSNSHLDKFTGIYDMNGKPICNGDTIRVHDTDVVKFKKEPIVGTVIWKNGNYQFKGNHWCEYNIYAWRKSVEVLETDRESVFESSTIDELLEKWESRNLNFMITDRVLIRKAFRDGFTSSCNSATKRYSEEQMQYLYNLLTYDDLAEDKKIEACIEYIQFLNGL
jgi:hypothetical protein